MARDYEVTAPNGKKFLITAPDDVSPDELERLARSAAGVGDSYPVVERPPEDGGRNLTGDARKQYEAFKQADANLPGNDYRRLINQGLTFGFSDEIAGAASQLMNPLTPGAYAQGRDVERAQIEDARKATGTTGTISELLGGFVGFNPGAVGSNLLRLGNAARAGAKAGAIGGGIGGFGSGDGAIDSLMKAGIGAGAGGLLGLTLPIAANVVSGRVSGISRLMGRDTTGLSRQIVGEALQADQITPAMAAQRLGQASERGVPMALADLGDNTRGLLASVSRRPGPGRAAVRANVDARQTEQSARVLGAIEQNLGPIRGVRAQSDELMQQADTAASPLYEQFRSQPGRTSDELQSLLDTPAGRSAIERARTIAANERRDPTALGFDLNDQGETILTRVASPETIDLVKRGLDDIIEQARDPVTRQVNYTPALRAVESVRAGLLREADNLYPVYGEARRAFAGPAAAEEALQLGRSMLNASAEDIAAATNRMGDFEREQFALGYRAAMADNVGRAVDGASQAQRMLGTPRKREALQSVFGDEQGLGRFMQTMADERATTDTYRSVMSGSQTAERLAADMQTSDTGLVETAAGATLRGVSQPIGLLGDALKALGEVGRFGPGEAGDRTRESVAALLTESNPELIDSLARAVREARIRQRMRGRAINRGAARLGGGTGNFAASALPAEQR